MVEAKHQRRKLWDNLLPEYKKMYESEIDDDSSEPNTIEAEAIIRDAYHAQASDIHIDPMTKGYLIRLRIDGIVSDTVELPKDEGRRVVNQFKTLAGINPLPSVKSEESSFLFEDEGFDVDLRVTAVPCSKGDKLAIRLLAAEEVVTDLDDLGLNENSIKNMRDWLDLTSGMLLVAGPTGSGKTTTLYTLLHHLKVLDTHVVTLEDPVEYQISGINQIQINDSHGINFHQGAQALLRLDPDYILLGEIRSQQSANAAIDITSSGRALMATIHSRDAVSVVSSLRNMGLEDAEIIANLSLVIAQRLVRKLCDNCKENTAVDETIADWIKKSGYQVPKTVWQAKGCDDCKQIGFKGRIGIFEMWQPSAKDRAKILAHADEFSLRDSIVKDEVTLMLEDGLQKVEQGLTTLDELVRVGAFSPSLMDS